MSDEEFLQEAQELIERVLEAETTNFLEIAKIVEINIKEDLVGANLGGFDLSNADLSGADLSDANLVGVNLSNANLSSVNLSNANLTKANLTNADLSNAKLNHANFIGADLSYANFIGANFLMAYTGNAILKGCKIKNEYQSHANLVVAYASYSETTGSDCSNINQFVASLGPVNSNDTDIEEFNNLVIEEVLKLGNENNSSVSQLFQEYLDKSAHLDEVELIFTYRCEIEEIEQAYKACKEASIWLSNKRVELVEAARNFICENKIKIEDRDQVAVPLEKVERFCESVNIYLLWIEHHIAKGSIPTPLPQGLIALALPANDYVQVFEFIRNYKISTDHDLSSAAVVELKGCFDRFLIKPLQTEI
jgi:uncharacterized protein YjbI with pentapeptide repeats